MHPIGRTRPELERAACRQLRATAVRRDHVGMGSGRRNFLIIASGTVFLMLLAASAPPSLLATFLVFVACVFGIYIWSDTQRRNEFKLGLGKLENRVAATPLGRLVARKVGQPIALADLEKHIKAERRERAIDLARRTGLVEEGARLVAEHRDAESAAGFARACGDDPTASFWLKEAYEAHRARGDWVLAAEAAADAGLYKQAMAAWGELPDGNGRLQQARLSEKTGHPREALEAYLDVGAGGDALRVAEQRDLLDELIAGAEARPNTDLWRMAGEACAKHGRFRKGVDLFRRCGDLRLALRAAKSGDLEEEQRELEAILEHQREAAAIEAARLRGYVMD